MKILTVIAATLYAVLLFLFAPQSIWDSEVKKAKGNATLKTPPMTPETLGTLQTLETPPTAHQTGDDTQMEKQKDIQDSQDNQDTQKTPEPLQSWTVAELRKLAQQRQIKWKDCNGKPLKKTELMKILAV